MNLSLIFVSVSTAAPSVVVVVDSVRGGEEVRSSANVDNDDNDRRCGRGYGDEIKERFTYASRLIATGASSANGMPGSTASTSQTSTCLESLVG